MEIREGLGLEMSDHVAKSLDRLVRDGYIEKDAEVSRGIRVVQPLPMPEEQRIVLETRSGPVEGHYFVIPSTS